VSNANNLTAKENKTEVI